MDSTTKTVYEVRLPRHFTARAVVWINLYGMVLGLFVAAAVLWVSFRPLGTSTYVIPLVAVAAATFCLPIGFGNTYVRRLAGRLRPGTQGDHVVQLAMSPRIRNGVLATMEDADDIGWLRLADNRLVYQGDSVSLELPLENIQSITLRNVGFRGLFIYGPRLQLAVKGLAGVEGVELADRSSIFLPQSRRRMKEIRNELVEKMKQGVPAN